jgi:hypothetical protein
MASQITVTVSGETGSGKSAIAGEIEIALKAIGVPVMVADRDTMVVADYQRWIDLYEPEVTIIEHNIPVKAGRLNIVDELRNEAIFDPVRQMAADEIERLRIQNAALLKVINDKLAIIDIQRDALSEAERFMAYFANETDGRFIGTGTPTTCLAQIRAALPAPTPESDAQFAADSRDITSLWRCTKCSGRFSYEASGKPKFCPYCRSSDYLVGN